MEDIKHDIEVIEEECEKIRCQPIFNILNLVIKLINDILKCFKFKNI
jgi:hypothetical protein